MYSCNVLDEQYAGAMAEHGFVPEPDNRRYGSMGLCWRQAGPGGSGYFWTYGQQDLYMLKIHDFYFHEDQLLEFCWPESLSVTWYESISGEEFSPCRRLVSGCVKSFIGGREPYRALIHRRVPIVSIGIEITPAYYQDYLRRQFSEEFQSLLESFQSLDQTDHFPEMVRLLKEVRDYRGEGLAAKLFYDGKVAEAVALVVERHRAHPAPRRTLTQEDERMLADVAAYITAHCADRLPLERLARIGCMGVSKLKDAFHARYGCTITQYGSGWSVRSSCWQIPTCPWARSLKLWAIRIPVVSRSSSAAAPGRARQRSGRSPTHGKQSERTRRTEKARRQEERQPPALGLLLSLKEPVNDLQSHRARYLW